MPLIECISKKYNNGNGNGGKEKQREKNDKSLIYLEQFLVSARKERKVMIVFKYAKGQ